MQVAGLRADEAGAIAALKGLQVLDSEPDAEFDALVRAASLLCGVPIALISLVDADRQWFKANLGLPGVTETSRDVAFCAHTVLGDEVLVVPDATRDERFADNPLVTGSPGIRFYAGAPMRLTSGHRVGSLCLIDRKPRQIGTDQLDALQYLAVAAAHALEGRWARKAAEEAARDSAHAALVLQHSADAIIGLRPDLTIVRWNPAAERLFGYSAQEIVGQSAAKLVRPEHRQAQRDACTRLANGQAQTYETVRVPRDGTDIAVAITLVPELDERGALLGGTMFARDNRPHLRALEDVAAREQLARRMYEATPAMLHTLDLEGRLTMVSDAWVARLGYTRGEVLGHRSVEFLTPASQEYAERQGFPTLMREGRCSDLALQMTCRSGEVVDVLLSAIVERDPTGAPVRFVAGLQDVTLRRRAERELDAERQRLLNIIEGTHAGIWEWHVPSGALRLNERSAAILGYTLAELGETNISLRAEHTHSDDKGPMSAAMQQHLGGQSSYYEVESRMRHRDGHWVWILDRGRLMTRTPDGKPEWVFGIHQDITARKLLEQQLTQQRRFLRHVIDSVPGLIAHIGLDRRYTMVSRAYVDWSGTGSQQIIGKSVVEVHGDEGRVKLEPQLERAFAGETVCFEVELSRRGARHAMQVTYVPERDDAGQVTGVFSLKVDVTPLRRAEERLRQVMEASPQGMFTTDLDGNCTFANAAWQRITGLTAEQSVGIGMRRVVHPDDLPGLLAKRRAAMEHNGVQTSEHRFVRPDGGIVWVRGHLTLLRGHDAPDCFVGSIEDVTERRQFDQLLADKSAELARSNEDLERFAYVASHDLQEPLRMVTSYGQLLARRHAAELSAQAQEFLGYMVDGGQRAQALIRDLLSLARLDSQSRPREEVALERTLEDTLLTLRLRIAETGAVVTHDPLPTVLADPAQMGQLLANLVGNALKFVGERAPVIHVGAAREGTAWRISVRDNGIGIDPKFFQRVFVMFQRLHLRSEHDGTGIGLALCKKIVERHGGHIGVSSVPGEGSTFYFTLPDAAGEPLLKASA